MKTEHNNQLRNILCLGDYVRILTDFGIANVYINVIGSLLMVHFYYLLLF